MSVLQQTPREQENTGQTCQEVRYCLSIHPAIYVYHFKWKKKSGTIVIYPINTCYPHFIGLEIKNNNNVLVLFAFFFKFRQN